MRCIFPSAVKTWQKVLCGTVGVTGLLGGITGICYGSVFVLESLPSYDYCNFKVEEVEEVENVVPIYSFGDNSIDCVYASAVFGTFGCLGIYGIYRDPSIVYRVFQDECRVFYRAICGTECCNIVRKTARFIVTGPITAISMAGLPYAILFCGFASYTFARGYYDECQESKIKKN